MIERSVHSNDEPNPLKMGEKTSDKLIWHSFKEGNRKAFQFIYDQNFEILLQYGLKIVPDQSFVEDQIQDFFIYLWKKKENLDIKKSITIYLIWSLRNRIFKAIKSEKKLTSDDGLDIIPENSATEDRLTPSELKSAVDVLPNKQREAIYLKYYQNLDGEEISNIMNITLGTTYNLLSRALSNLRKQLPNLSLALLAYGF